MQSDYLTRLDLLGCICPDYGLRYSRVLFESLAAASPVCQLAMMVSVILKFQGANGPPGG